MTTLFHGSYAIVSQPQVAHGRRNLDFGRGFYLTSLRPLGIISAEQALGQLRYKPVNHQLCIINQSVIDRCLRFVEAVTLTPEAL